MITVISGTIRPQNKTSLVAKHYVELLKKKVIDEFGYYQKGSLVEKYVGFGLVFGVAIGAGFSSFSAAYSGAGIAIGLAIGAGIGTKKEKDEEEAGNIY